MHGIQVANQRVILSISPQALSFRRALKENRNPGFRWDDDGEERLRGTRPAHAAAKDRDVSPNAGSWPVMRGASLPEQAGACVRGSAAMSAVHTGLATSAARTRNSKSRSMAVSRGRKKARGRWAAGAIPSMIYAHEFTICSPTFQSERPVAGSAAFC
jgi:hypothetical protein